MTRLTAILLLVGACFWNASAIDRLYVMNSSLNVTNTGWAYYDGTDAPDGGYMCWSGDPGVVSLGQTIPAGTYALLLEAGTYLTTTNVIVSVGDATNTVALTTVSGQGMWKGKGVFTTTTAFSTIVFDSYDKWLLIGLAVSSHTNDIINSRYMVGDFTAVDSTRSLSPSGNLLDNSSFELGMSGWFIVPTTVRSNTSDYVSRSVSRTGSNSVAIITGHTLYSRLYWVPPNAQVTMSAWIKASATPHLVSIGLANPSTVPAGGTNYTYHCSSLIGTDWTRIVCTNYSWAYPSNVLVPYAIYISEPYDGNTIWIDDVQFQVGGVTAYSARTSDEVSVSITNYGNVFVGAGSHPARIEFYHSGASASKSVTWKVYDWRNNCVSTNSFTQTLTNGYNSKAIDLAGDYGPKRIVVTMDSEQCEAVYSIIPALSYYGTNSTFGTHPNANYYQSVATRNAAQPWYRTLSPAGLFFWNTMNTNTGVFVWRDAEFSELTNANVNILGTLSASSSDGPPAFAIDHDHFPKMDALSNYVFGVVNRYKEGVKYWELWNEPDQYGWTGAEYAQVCTQMVSAVRAADPAAKTVAGGGASQSSFIQDVITALGDDWWTNMNAFSVHLYPPNEVSASNLVHYTLVDKVPAWQTESGTIDSGSYLGQRSPWFLQSDYVYPYASSSHFFDANRSVPETVAKNAIQSLGDGCVKFFYYDWRQWSSPYSRYFSAINDDDSIEPKAVVLGAMASMVNGFTSVTNVSRNGLSCWIFNGGQVSPVAALWAETNGTLTVSGSFYSVDWMGNWTAGVSPASVGRMPSYIAATNQTYDDFIASMKVSTLTTNADITAPKPIVLRPSGYGSTNLWRWVAFDDCSVPSKTSDGIVYSTRERNGAWSAWSANTYSFSTQSTLEVRAKDSAGNVSDVFIYGIYPTSGGAKITTPGKLTVIGKVTL